MKVKLEKLSQLALQSASSVGRGLLSAQHVAQDFGQQVAKDVVCRTNVAASMAVTAGKTVQQTLTEVIAHEHTQALVEQVKERSMQFADGASSGAKKVGTQVLENVRKLDEKLEENHAQIKEKTEAVSMSMGLAAGVVAGAAIVGPPLVVAAAPVIAVAATVTGAVAGSAYFYSKWKVKKAQRAQADAPRQDEE